jgi:hypothetical protein
MNIIKGVREKSNRNNNITIIRLKEKTPSRSY